MSDSGITLTLDSLRSKLEEIEELDSQISAASGSESAGKRSVQNGFVKEYEADWKSISEKLFAILDNVEGERLVGAFAGLTKALQNQYGEKVSTFLDEYVQTNAQPDAEKTSAEELESVLAKRRGLVQEYNAFRQLLEMFGQNVESIGKPKKMTGSRGPRGPRAISLFTWSVDGVRQAPKQDSIAGVASEQGFDGAKALRDFLKEQVVSQETAEDGTVSDVKLDLKNPPERIEVVLPNGKTLVGEKSAVEADDDDDDDETDTDSE